MKNFNTEQTIKNLEHVESLLKTALTNQRLANSGYLDNAHEEIRMIKNDIGTLPNVPTLCNTFPTFPIDDTDLKKAEKDMEERKKLLIPVGGATALLLVIYFISHIDFLNTLSVIGFFATAVIGYLFFSQKTLFENRKKRYNESVAESTRTMQAFRDALSLYENEKARGVESAKSYAVRYREGYQQSIRILHECQKKCADAIEKSADAFREVEELDILPPEYYYHVPQMISLLKSGRADDQKEALNMAIEIERQDEIEAQRRAEESRRLAVMERQAEEERRHNMQMERQQRDHERAMEQQARESARRQENAERDARRKASEQAARDDRAGYRHCNSCANVAHCSSGVKHKAGSVHCGGYRPR